MATKRGVTGGGGCCGVWSSLHFHLFLSMCFLIINARHLGKTATVKNPLNKTNCSNYYFSDSEVKALIFENAKSQSYQLTDRPIRQSINAIEIEFSFILHGVIAVSERDGTVKFAGYLQLEWQNEFVIWNETFPFNCTDRVTMNRGQTWLPDVSLINAANEIFGLMGTQGFVIAMDSDGFNAYSPGGEIVVYCKLDLSLFPFDEHNCSLIFEAWSNNYEMQRFRLAEQAFMEIRFQDNEQWDLLGLHAQLNNATYEDNKTYHQAEFIVTIRRKVAYYNLNVILPSFVISLVELVTFTLQEDDVVKLHISFTCLLSYSVFQVMIIGDMPRSSQNTPLLSVYIVAQMVLIGLTILLEGAVYVLFSKSNGRRPVPNWIYQIFKVLGKILIVSEERVEEIMLIRFSTHDQGKSNTNRRETIALRSQNHHKPSNMFESPRKRHNSENTAAKLLNNIPEETSFLAFDHSGNAKVCRVASGVGKAIERPLITVTTSGDDGDESLPQTQQIRSNSIPSLLTVGPSETARHWIFVAQVVDRFTLVFYLSAILLTPFIMFVILPAANTYSYY